MGGQCSWKNKEEEEEEEEKKEDEPQMGCWLVAISDLAARLVLADDLLSPPYIVLLPQP